MKELFGLLLSTKGQDMHLGPLPGSPLTPLHMHPLLEFIRIGSKLMLTPCKNARVSKFVLRQTKEILTLFLHRSKISQHPILLVCFVILS